VEGNRYQVVRLGSQIRLSGNLRVTRTLSGAPLITFAPDDDTTKITACGGLYRWEAARHACPTGWQLPADEACTSLGQSLGPPSALRLRDSEYWPADSTSVEYLVPFRARPAGYANDQGFDNEFGSVTVYWTASPSRDLAWSRVVRVGQAAVRHAEQHPQYGLSVRWVGNR
jgi:uncharacterized protein (TIGR02145 family)